MTETGGDTMTTPDLLPLLRQGTGATPKDGGCLIQVAGYLHDGRSWVDDTPCVHPVLRGLAIHVNDEVSDGYRPRLAPLAADLVGTGPEPADPTEAKVLNVRLAVWACRRVQHLMTDSRSVAAVDAAEAWADCPCEEHQQKADAAWAAAGAAAWAAAGDAAWDAAWAAAWAAAGAAAGAAARAAARDETLHTFLADAIAEHARLTGHTPAPVDRERWGQVCDLIGATT